MLGALHRPQSPLKQPLQYRVPLDCVSSGPIPDGSHASYTPCNWRWEMHSRCTPPNGINGGQHCSHNVDADLPGLLLYARSSPRPKGLASHFLTGMGLAWQPDLPQPTSLQHHQIISLVHVV